MLPLRDLRGAVWAAGTQTSRNELMNANSPKVVVIGAGIAGLAAAFRLRQAGISVQVLEADATPGGRVQSVRRNGYIFDTGADALTDGYTEYLSLLRDVGLHDRLVPLPSVIGTVRAGRVIYMDAASTWSMATTRLLSLGAKLRLYRGFRRVSRLADGMQLAHMHRLSGLDDPSQSAQVLSEQMFGKEASDYLIDPMVRTLGGSGLGGSSWVDVVAGLGVVTQGNYCLRGGQAILPEALVRTLDVRYRCRVRNVREHGNRVTVSFEDEQGRAQSMDTGGCVLATMYEAGVELYPPLADASRDYRQHLSHMKLGKIHLSYTARTRTKAYVIQVPTVEDSDVMLVFLEHNKCPDRAPPGHSVVTVYSETNVASKYLNQSDEQLTGWARSKAERWFPELAGHFDLAQITRWPVMAPAATPGYYARAAQVLKQIPQNSRVQIACDMFSKTSQESAANWGASAARNLLPLLT